MSIAFIDALQKRRAQTKREWDACKMGTAEYYAAGAKLNLLDWVIDQYEDLC